MFTLFPLGKKKQCMHITFFWLTFFLIVTNIFKGHYLIILQAAMKDIHLYLRCIFCIQNSIIFGKGMAIDGDGKILWKTYWKNFMWPFFLF